MCASWLELMAVCQINKGGTVEQNALSKLSLWTWNIESINIFIPQNYYTHAKELVFIPNGLCADGNLVLDITLVSWIADHIHPPLMFISLCLNHLI